MEVFNQIVGGFIIIFLSCAGVAALFCASMEFLRRGRRKVSKSRMKRIAVLERAKLHGLQYKIGFAIGALKAIALQVDDEALKERIESNIKELEEPDGK